VILEFDKHVPEMTAAEIKELLIPVFDFHAKSAVEAYLDTLPSQVKDAVENHEVLVGMNRDMVTYSKGRPPRKIRETTDGVSYEEWIYGTPPQDVEFVRFVDDEVVRLVIMSVDGKREELTDRDPAFDSPEFAKGRPGPGVPEADPAAAAAADPAGAGPAGAADPETAAAAEPADSPAPARSKRPTLRRPDEQPTDTLPEMKIPDSSPRQPGEWGVPGSGDPEQTPAPGQQPPTQQ
jgi:hypothetical protein